MTSRSSDDEEMLVTYQGIIHSDADGMWIEFPDIPGCFSHAKDIPELLINSREVLECAVLGMLESGESLPAAKSALRRPHTMDEFLTYVQVDVNLAKNYRSVKKTLTIPAWLDEQATAKHLNFSKVLQEALVASL